MKWLIVPAMWVAAAIVAVAILWRLARGKNIILSDRFSPKFVRMVVVMLVMLGAGADGASAVPRTREATGNTGGDAGQPDSIKLDESTPPLLNEQTIRVWRYAEARFSVWPETKQSLIELESLSEKPDEQLEKRLADAVRRLPQKLRAIATTELEAVKAGKPKPTVKAEQLSEILLELESGGMFDNWTMAYLWRTTARLPDDRDDAKTVELFKALYRHARLMNTLARANAAVRPPVFRPWRSKAAPPPDYRLRETDTVGSILKSAIRFYPNTDAGTWQREAGVALAIDEKSAQATLISAGERQPLVPGKTVRLNRLALIETPKGETPVVLEHDWLGSIELPPGKTLTVFDLPGLLTANAKAKAEQAAAAALTGDEQAIERLERTLPLCHPAIRAALKKSPNATGSPRLRLILSLFNE